MPKKTTTSPTAELLARAIAFSGKTNADVAAEAGFARPNVISMFTQGQSRIPLRRIPGLAKACHVDPIFFFRIALQEYHPELHDTIKELLGEPLTKNEWQTVFCYRAVAERDEIEMKPTVCEAVMEALQAFKEEDDQ